MRVLNGRWQRDGQLRATDHVAEHVGAVLKASTEVATIYVLRYYLDLISREIPVVVDHRAMNWTRCALK